MFKVLALALVVLGGHALGQSALTTALETAVTDAESGFLPNVYELLAMMVSVGVGFALVGMLRK